MTAQSCVYCQATGGLEPIGNAAGNLACTRTTLCQLRQQGLDPVDVALQLARELAQEREHLTSRELARLSLVFKAARGWLFGQLGCRADSAVSLEQAQADLGCKRCGAMGPDEPCRTRDGQPVSGYGPASYHAGRRF